MPNERVSRSERGLQPSENRDQVPRIPENRSERQHKTSFSPKEQWDTNRWASLRLHSSMNLGRILLWPYHRKVTGRDRVPRTADRHYPDQRSTCQHHRDAMPDAQSESAPHQVPIFRGPRRKAKRIKPDDAANDGQNNQSTLEIRRTASPSLMAISTHVSFLWSKPARALDSK